MSYSGILGTFSKEGRNPDPPNNVLADFAGGGGFGVIGILLALYERERTGKVFQMLLLLMVSYWYIYF